MSLILEDSPYNILCNKLLKCGKHECDFIKIHNRKKLLLLVNF